MEGDRQPRISIAMTVDVDRLDRHAGLDKTFSGTESVCLSERPLHRP